MKFGFYWLSSFVKDLCKWLTDENRQRMDARAWIYHKLICEPDSSGDELITEVPNQPVPF